VVGGFSDADLESSSERVLTRQLSGVVSSLNGLHGIAIIGEINNFKIHHPLSPPTTYEYNN